jgi:hypothetical protein
VLPLIAEKTTAFFYPLKSVRLQLTYQGIQRCLWIDGNASSLRDLFAFGTAPQRALRTRETTAGAA